MLDLDLAGPRTASYLLAPCSQIRELVFHVHKSLFCAILVPSSVSFFNLATNQLQSVESIVSPTRGVVFIAFGSLI